MALPIDGGKRLEGRGGPIGHARWNLTKLGERIAYVRTLKRYTQVMLGDVVGVSSKCVRDWEHNRQRPCLNHLAEVADACDTTIPYLLGYEGYDEPFRVFTGETPLRTVGKQDRKKLGGKVR